jgi:hypothetical protein
LPSTVASVFAAAGLEPQGVVGWGIRPSKSGSGVYTVALTDRVDSLTEALAEPPLSPAAAEHLLAVRPELRVDGQRPSAAELCARIASFWLPDEVVVYVGLAGSSVASRVSAYYETPLGAKRPHAGGWFLKLLEPGALARLHVHFTAADDPDGAEDDMLRHFGANVSTATLARLPDPANPFPFANLEWPRGVRKAHGISGARGLLPG